MASSGSGEEVQPVVHFLISNCVATVQMLGLDREFPVRRSGGKRDVEEEAESVPLHLHEDKTKSSVRFVK